ncbi:MAG: hypothetical protein PHD46_06885 [Eubacteriales bacterium]|nr:hypothetical protein [Eubacteriales bacterium]
MKVVGKIIVATFILNDKTPIMKRMAITILEIEVVSPSFYALDSPFFVTMQRRLCVLSALSAASGTYHKVAPSVVCLHRYKAPSSIFMQSDKSYSKKSPLYQRLLDTLYTCVSSATADGTNTTPKRELPSSAEDNTSTAKKPEAICSRLSFISFHHNLFKKESNSSAELRYSLLAADFSVVRQPFVRL